MAPDTWDPAACQGSIEGWRLQPIHLHFRWQDTDLNPNAEPLVVVGGGGAWWQGAQLWFRVRFTRGGEQEEAATVNKHNTHVLADKGDMRNGAAPEAH